MRWLWIAGCVLTTLLLGTFAAEAQWLSQPTPGLPRNAEGRVEVDRPAPRSADGRPDLSGLWRVELAPVFAFNITADVDPVSISTVASELSNERMLDLGKDDPSAIGCLPLGPRSVTRGGLTKVIHTPTLVVLLYEDLCVPPDSSRRAIPPERPEPNVHGLLSWEVGRRYSGG